MGNIACMHSEIERVSCNDCAYWANEKADTHIECLQNYNQSLECIIQVWLVAMRKQIEGGWNS